MSNLPLDVQDFINRLRAGPDMFVDGRPLTVGRAPGRLDVMGGIADYSGSLVLQWPIRESTRVAVQFQPSPYLHIISVRSPDAASTTHPQDAAPGTQHAAHGTQHAAPGTQHAAPGTQHPAPGTQHSAPSTRHPAPSTGPRTQYPAPGTHHSSVKIPLSLVKTASPPYAELRAWFAAHGDGAWAAYVAGVFAVLAAERAVGLPDGAAVLVESDVPEGKGVSSSAALEAATMTAVTGALGLRITPREMALLCQRAENLVVGAPCGVMDQMSSICGEQGALLALLCQPAELQGTQPLPSNLGVWGIDSGIRHAVTGADYMSVRIGAFMGYRILADLAGLAVEAAPGTAHVRVLDPRWHGYLANVGIEAFESFRHRIPEAIDGAGFLGRYQGTTDPVTTVDPDARYAVRIPAAHPVYEHHRVTRWAGMLSARPADGPLAAEAARRLGALMFESHESYSLCGLGSDGTDLLVDLARGAGSSSGVYGAKITGGGSGGTVAVLAEADAGAAVHRIAAEYRSRTGRETYVFEGSSPGAAAIGPITVSFD